MGEQKEKRRGGQRDDSEVHISYSRARLVQLIVDTDRKLGAKYDHNFKYHFKNIGHCRIYGEPSKRFYGNILTDGSKNCLYSNIGMGAITKNEIRKWVFEATEDCFKRLIAAQTYHTNEHLTKDQALAFLDGRGYKTTISKLYKLSAAGEIPSTKINGKLSFLKSDLQEWVDQQIEHYVSRANAGKLLAESAMRKESRGNSL